MAYAFELFGRQHDRATFSCGVAGLDGYLKHQASQDMKRRLASCYVLVETGKPTVLGYYTLSSSSVLFQSIPDDLAKKLPRYPQIPAILLGRLAVDQRAQGQGLSKILLIDALKRALNAEISAPFVVVDALDEHLADYYAHRGFLPLQDAPLRLILPMAQVMQLP